MKWIIKTEFVDLVRFLFYDLRLERKFPIRDNFVLIKDLTHNENMALNRFNNYIILSDTYFEEEWGQQEILNYVLSVIKTRRKPKIKDDKDREILDNETFEHNIKLLFVADQWPNEADDKSMFNLFKTLDYGSSKKYIEFFKLANTYSPNVIFYSVLSFINKCHTVSAGEVSGAYYRVLMSKKRNITATFQAAIKRYSAYPVAVDDSFKLLRFLYDLSDRHVQ